MKIYHVEAGMLATNCYFAVNEAIGEGVIFGRRLPGHSEND